MAINPNTKYPGLVTAPDADYPYGSSKNESSPGANDGTPYEKARANDIFGFQQAILNEAEIVPSGNADTVLDSQYMEGLKKILTRNKNAIINGNFDIWQRATSQTADGYGSDDRWYNGRTGSTQVASQQTFTLGQTDVPNNPKFYARTVVTSVAGASNSVYKYQNIEGVEKFAGETVMLSFYAKADAAKDMAVEFAQHFGSGGSPSATVNISPTTINLTTSWQKFTVPAAIPSISGKTIGTDNNDFLRLRYWFDAGSDLDSQTNSLGQQSGTFDISEVQIEKGSVATSFERRSIGEELVLCQRYYQFYKDLFFAVNTLAPSEYVGKPLIAEMRSSPSGTFNNFVDVDSSGISITSISPVETAISAIGMSGTKVLGKRYKVDIALDAEL